jgi:hypothetical protein
MSQNERALQLLSARWWTVRDLGRAMGMDPKGARWHVHQIARHRPVFARVATASLAKRKPRAFRVFPQAVDVRRAA